MAALRIIERILSLGYSHSLIIESDLWQENSVFRWSVSASEIQSEPRNEPRKLGPNPRKFRKTSTNEGREAPRVGLEPTT